MWVDRPMGPITPTLACASWSRSAECTAGTAGDAAPDNIGTRCSRDEIVRTFDLVYNFGMFILGTNMQNRDAQYLAKLRDYHAEHRLLPSYSKIAALLGLRSTSAVAAMVKRMKAVGVLESGPGGRLLPGRAFFTRPIAETERGGDAAPTHSRASDGINIDAFLIGQPSRTVLVTVKDDSMTDAGLIPGDVVIVKTGAPAQPGDVVAAIQDDDLTVKFLDRGETGFFLRAGNKAQTMIRPADDPNLLGVVVGMFRRYPPDASRSGSATATGGSGTKNTSGMTAPISD